MEAGRGKAGGDGERKGKPFLPSEQAAAASLARGVPPRAPRPWGSASPLDYKRIQESDLAHPYRFRNEETRGGITCSRSTQGGARLPFSGGRSFLVHQMRTRGPVVPGESTNLSSVRNHYVYQPRDFELNTSPQLAYFLVCKKTVITLTPPSLSC